MIRHFAILLICACTVAGCDRDDEGTVRVQEVPKQPLPAATNTLATGEMPAMPGAVADPGSENVIAFAAPHGWTKEPAKSMRIVSFTVGTDADKAEMIVTRFPANSGSVLDNINRWRGQIQQQPAASETEVSSTEIKVDSITGKKYDMTGPSKRLTVAWIEKDGQWWFFKLLGPTDVMQQQQPNFDAFINSIKFRQ